MISEATMFTVNPPRALWALLAALLALALFVNGAAMMGAPLSWYGFIPGVAATGPFNGHFVSDIGAAYVAAAVSLAFAVGRLERAAAAPAAAFLVLHALIHLIPLEGALSSQAFSSGSRRSARPSSARLSASTPRP
jgi:hypothetical protein